MKTLTLLLLFVATIAFGQNRPEQDCVGAINLCDSIYIVNPPYVGYGFEQDLLDLQGLSISKCIQNGENNSVWFQFEITSFGTLEFLIIPSNNGGDYDFSLFDLTNADCSAIGLDPSIEVRCSYTLSRNAIGLQTGYTQTIAGPGDSAFLAPLQVNAGDRYALMIDNFDFTPNAGFRLDFTASTASIGGITDDYLVNTACISSNATVELFTPIACGSIDSSGSQFRLIGTNAPTVISASPIDCANDFTRKIRLQFSDSLISGNSYSLVVLGDTNSLPFVTNCDTIHSVDTLMLDSNNIVFNLNASFTYNNINGTSVLFTNNSSGADSYSWNLGDGTITNTLNPSKVYNQPGNYLVCLFAMRGDCIDKICSNVMAGAVGLSELNGNINISIYPNPASTRLSIELSGEVPETVSVYNTLGKLLISLVSTTEVDVSHLPDGTYFLHVAGADYSVSKAFIVLH